MFFMINNATFSYIFRTYKPITTYNQRCQHERDFQSENPDYVELTKNADAVALKFFVRIVVYIISTYWQFLHANLYIVTYLFETKETFA